jgi:hypothetical protein
MVIDHISLVTNTKVAEGFLSQESDFGGSTRALAAWNQKKKKKEKMGKKVNKWKKILNM